ncbi:hypothetical protein DSO57_1000606 [Entomophthora muscae]|uniref:Uncharacterized protein n=1 Tax=Entomophthora muscae TaxID=34485 RepID=A0ACC2S0G4_9FUNG|nr:hypothetical protein DSO57_1000606 [Entomophthora muscae]
MRLLKASVIYFVIICVGLPLLYRFYVSSGKLQQPSFSMYGTKPQPETQGNRVKACFVVLIRNTELEEWRTSMLQLEDRFNKHHNYPYVFLNNVLFTDEFKKSVQALTKAKIDFGLVPSEHWSYPAFIDQGKAKHKREQMKRDGVMHGDKESYHHMCRFESGFFFLHNLTLEYDYYWRVEPGVSLCDITRDPFLLMQQNNLKYGFTISLHEYLNTIPTLWSTVRKWIDERSLRKNLPKDNAMQFISDDGGRTYNMCHF